MGRGQPFERIDAVVWIELRASPAHDPRGLRIGADHGDAERRLGRERQSAVIFQQHDAFGAGAADQGARLWAIVGPFVGNLGILESADPSDEAQDPSRRFPHRLVRNLAVIAGRQELVAAVAPRPRHFEIEPGRQRLGGRPGSKPVRHDEAVEPPFASQEAVDQRRLLADIGPVEAVVGRHQGPAPAAGHSGFERRQVDLAQSPLVDVGTDGGALIFRFVADVMLDRCCDPQSLEAADIGHRDLGRQERVLGVAFKIAPVEGRAMNVDRRGEQHPRALRFRFQGQRFTDLVDESEIPRRGERDRHGKGCRRHPSHESAAAPNAVRAVA